MNYKKLINKAAQEFDSFSLVWRDNFKFSENATVIQNELNPYLIKEQRTSKWPGTEIFKALATVRHYKITPQTMKILSRLSSFNEWLAPNYPEDLAFYKNNKNIYASIAHENEQWFTNYG